MKLSNKAARLVKVAMAQAGVNQGELAERLNISQSLMSYRMKAGNFTIDDLDEIANVLGGKLEIRINIEEQ